MKAQRKPVPSRLPGPFEKVRFGKHQGKTWDQVPSRYLEWMIRVKHYHIDVAIGLLNQRVDEKTKGRVS